MLVPGVQGGGDALVPDAQGVMKRFALREQAGADPQTYALGLKEVWEVRTHRTSAAAAVTAWALRVPKGVTIQKSGGLVETAICRMVCHPINSSACAHLELQCT